VVWAVSEGASVVASDIHSFAVSESEARSGEAASTWWHSEAGIRCDTISFQQASALDVRCFSFAGSGPWECVGVNLDVAYFRFLFVWDLNPRSFQFCIFLFSRPCLL
jgi:hypothetical protein